MATRDNLARAGWDAAEAPHRASPTAPNLVSIIVPTYREADNLRELVPRIDQALVAAGLLGEIVVVDDDSQDGTQFVCAALARDLTSTVRLIVRVGQKGLSSAVLAGLQESRGTTMVVMDADLSHPPELIPHLLDELSDPVVTFVIGSRYAEGGSTSSEWSVLRWLNSQIATLLARPFTDARDPMSGFFALRRSTWQNAPVLDPVGYKIGLEFIVKCNCTVKEIPIDFGQRRHGASKLSWRQQVQYLLHLARLAKFKWFSGGH